VATVRSEANDENVQVYTFTLHLGMRLPSLVETFMTARLVGVSGRTVVSLSLAKDTGR